MKAKVVAFFFFLGACDTRRIFVGYHEKKNRKWGVLKKKLKWNVVSKNGGLYLQFFWEMAPPSFTKEKKQKKFEQGARIGQKPCPLLGVNHG